MDGLLATVDGLLATVALSTEGTGLRFTSVVGVVDVVVILLTGGVAGFFVTVEVGLLKVGLVGLTVVVVVAFLGGNLVPLIVGRFRVVAIGFSVVVLILFVVAPPP